MTKVKSGDITANEAIDSIAKGLTGSSIMALGMMLAQMGLLTGSGDEEDKKMYFDRA